MECAHCQEQFDDRALLEAHLEEHTKTQQRLRRPERRMHGARSKPDQPGNTQQPATTSTVSPAIKQPYDLLASMAGAQPYLPNSPGHFRTIAARALRAIQARKKKEGKLELENPDVLKDIHHVVQLLRKQSRYSQAEIMLKYALAQREERFGSGSSSAREVSKDLVRVLLDQKKYKEAEEVQRDSLFKVQDKVGKLDPDTKEDEWVLGAILALEGSYPAAEKTLVAALDLKDDTFENETSTSRQMMIRLLAELILSETDRDNVDGKAVGVGNLYAGLDKLDEAEKMELFNIEAEMAPLLHDLSDEDLRSFAESQEDPANDEQIELYIYTCFLIFTRTRSTEYLEHAILRTEGWVAVIAEDHPDRARRLQIFDMMSARMIQLKHILEDDVYNEGLLQAAMEDQRRNEDLQKAIEVPKLALQVTPEDHANRARRLNDLGYTLFCRFQQTGRMEYLEEAIQKAELAIDVMPEDYQSQAAHLHNLEFLLNIRFERTGRMAHPEQVIQTARLAVQATPEDHPDRADKLDHLASILTNRFKQTGQMKDLEEAVQKSKLSVQATPKKDLNLARKLNDLAFVLSRRFEKTRQIGDLEEAIQNAKLAVEVMPEHYQHRATCLGTLAGLLRQRSELIGQLEDHDEGIHTMKLAMQVMSEDHPDRALMLNNLGIQLGNRYQRTGRIEDLKKAIQKAELAVQAASDNHPDRPAWLNDLGNMLCWQFGRTGQMEDLEKAIQNVNLAVQTMPKDHPDRAACVNNLGSQLSIRYERTGQMENLNEAIQKVEWAVQATPKHHPNRTTCLNSLGFLLFLRYERTRQMEDLEEAIRNAKLAVEVMQDGYENRAAFLDILGLILRTRSARTGRIEDLDEAIRNVKLAVQIMPVDHPGRAGPLSHLGGLLGWRFERTRQTKDFEEAVQNAELALHMTSEDDPRRAACLNNLGLILKVRFDQTGQMTDLEQAIQNARLAVGAMPDDHPDLAARLNTLGRLLRARFEKEGEMTDLEEATSSYLRSWCCRNGIPYDRVRAASRCIDLLYTQKRLTEAAEVAKGAIDLLPNVNSRSLDLADQQYVVSMFSGIAAKVCSLLVESGEPEQATEYLEKGRTVILSLIMDNRRDISELKAEYPNQASAYECLRDEVNSPLRDLDDTLKRRSILRRRREAVRELEELISEIRLLPGQTRFLLGPTPAEIRTHAADGHIIVVNVTNMRSDAVIVSSTTIHSMHLPGLSYSKVKYWLQKDLTRGRRSTRVERNSEYRNFLCWLWEDCVRPILEEAGHRSISSTDTLPRVWWIGTGLASFLPFHAAGHHSPGSTENTYCRAISSYTPSIKALIYSRERTSTTQIAPTQLLFTSMPTTPGMSALPGVIEESARVVKALPNVIRIQPLSQPDASQVIERLEECSIAHFACHGISDHKDPSSSGLILQKCGSPNSHEIDILTVRAISEVSSNQGKIAYLSACSTAENKSVELADEAIHMASGFHIAGFSHVIGCMWPSIDEVCAEVAASFYSSLFSLGQIPVCNRDVALALHEAVTKVRCDDWNWPLNWAQYIHYGV